MLPAHRTTRHPDWFSEPRKRTEANQRSIVHVPSRKRSPVVLTNSKSANNEIHRDDGIRITSDLVVLIQSLSHTDIFTIHNEYGRCLLHCEQKDDWSCGYRNFQMMLSALIPSFSRKNHLFSTYYKKKSIPCLREIQYHLEKSWTEGFDPMGAQHFNNSILDKKSWIGAVDLSFLLSYFFIDNTVVQFVSDKSRPSHNSRTLLGRFVFEYFSKSCRKEALFLMSPSAYETAANVLRMAKANNRNRTPQSSSFEYFAFPIYLQWSGHSVTIVGVERLSRRYSFGNMLRSRHKNNEEHLNLLILDPKNQYSDLKILLHIASMLQQSGGLGDKTRFDVINEFRLPINSLPVDASFQIIILSSKPLTTLERMSIRQRQEGSIIHACDL